MIGGEHIIDINHIKKLLSSQLEMKDMKELHYFLGIEVIWTVPDQGYDLPTTLHPRLVIQIWNNKVQIYDNPSRSQPKTRC